MQRGTKSIEIGDVQKCNGELDGFEAWVEQKKLEYNALQEALGGKEKAEEKGKEALKPSSTKAGSES